MTPPLKCREADTNPPWLPQLREAATPEEWGKARDPLVYNKMLTSMLLERLPKLRELAKEKGDKGLLYAKLVARLTGETPPR